jgi:hypothetical protein
MTKIRFELSPKPSKQEKVEKGLSGFVPIATTAVLGWARYSEGGKLN